MEKVDRFGFKNEEQVFHRYFPLYTVALRYYPEIYSLLEKHPDLENPRTISSNFNIIFAIIRYQTMVKNLVNLQAVSEADEDVLQEVKELRKVIDTLDKLKYQIAHNPSSVKKAILVKDKVLDFKSFSKKE
ncbi:hypothetical protein [Liquorilactobacillus mali]|uniref:Uncharacterized protein n=2 Tax=Liquorilactobacillus mali TaxID=1618 RepID=J0L6L2_9LACO|nr:hypothetical protein [Liquorilactobacillus mali]EJF00567.1 hypothetical protein LMA_03299 [Liquorilactobacillus mali KCTC 3596 = DSM 20444]KRN10180.1 hypothetical protein FD00_GL000415 [Liquorilactobacillus mali KCTC 3596 = DSM 20444]KRN30253.1 hypothetical protein IV36_GL002292 [Liquorilactobacillus mali]MDC7953052.1 hypothetical protein [Liquorilactobacillus mali]MDN7146603.1 hypothetical protein [Liquorilactobacillus mali]